MEASRSKGGVPIIALRAQTTLKDGTIVSRIVAMIKQGRELLQAATMFTMLFTEFGVADLYGKTIRQRAKQLINIAHPEFPQGPGEAGQRIKITCELYMF